MVVLGLHLITPIEAFKQAHLHIRVEQLLLEYPLGLCCGRPSELVLNCPCITISKGPRTAAGALWTVLTEADAGPPSARATVTATQRRVCHQEQLPPWRPCGSRSRAPSWEAVQGHLWELRWHVAWGDLPPLAVPCVSHIYEVRVCFC